MMKSAQKLSLLAGLSILFTGFAAANQDEEGCKDHPLFTRLPNHYIYSCQHSQFEMRRFPIGLMNKENMTKLQEVEGEFWTIEYGLKEGATKASGLQVQRNFQNAAKQVGGIVEGTYPEWCSLNLDDSFKLGNPCTNYGTTLKLNKGGKEFWTFVNATGVADGYILYILARQAMKQDISVNELVNKLNKDGFLTLYVNFDTGKATIKADSNKTLDDAAGALKAASTLKIEVGGHTDNVGTPQTNQKLSADRAQSVMTALVQRGVASNRLTAKGYGQSAPVADNRSEEGRARNRRVELVKQ
ncbi:MAG: OmpA family protein [Sulfuricella denitrificans]|nr:OmpA family protein [Sulfuricella denitrificans]